jgi:mannose-6-phosphate isomerase-like protein (cupin superfamily)
MEQASATSSRAAWTNDFELQGAAREEALARIGRVLDGWGLKLPGDPMPMHFGLHDFENIGETEFWIVNDTANNYCGKFLFMFNGQRCPLHYHNIKDETFFIVRGDVEMELDGELSTLHPGNVLKVEPGRNHTFRAVGGPALVLEVSLPSLQGDNIFADRRIGVEGAL